MFPAVDKNDTEKINLLIKKYCMKIKSGAAGCALSHILVLEKFLETDSKYHIVMEDDLVILHELPSKNTEVDNLIKSLKQTYNSTDIVYLSGRVNCNESQRINNGCGTEGYLVTRHGAIKLLQIINKNLNHPIDLTWQAHFYPDDEYSSFSSEIIYSNASTIINSNNIDGGYSHQEFHKINSVTKRESAWCSNCLNKDVDIVINAFKAKKVYVGIGDSMGSTIKNNIEVNNINKYKMILIGSYHKTGSVLFSKIWEDYFNHKTKDYIDYNHFDHVTNDMITHLEI